MSRACRYPFSGGPHVSKLRLYLVFALLTALALALMLVAGASAGAGASPGAPEFEDGVVLVGFQPGTSAVEQEAIEIETGANERERVGKGTHVLVVPKGSVEA